jgi:hypothetical protein
VRPPKTFLQDFFFTGINMDAKEHRTYDLALPILHEEIQHESWFSEFLGEGPSEHFLRKGDTSPFVSKFLE